MPIAPKNVRFEKFELWTHTQPRPLHVRMPGRIVYAGAPRPVPRRRRGPRPRGRARDAGTRSEGYTHISIITLLRLVSRSLIGGGRTATSSTPQQKG
jgi:hypothetical protein